METILIEGNINSLVSPRNRTCVVWIVAGLNPHYARYFSSVYFTSYRISSRSYFVFKLFGKINSSRSCAEQRKPLATLKNTGQAQNKSNDVLLYQLIFIYFKLYLYDLIVNQYVLYYRLLFFMNLVLFKLFKLRKVSLLFN